MERKRSAPSFFTSVEIDEQVWARACPCFPPKTTVKKAINEALRTFGRLHQQAQVRALRGKLVWNGDLNDLREDRRADPR